MGTNDDEEEEKESYVGRSVKKFFAGFGYFLGKVISFDRTHGFYKVKYDDGDREEVDLKELKEILVAIKEPPEARGTRARKRRRESLDREGTSEAGNRPNANANANAIPNIVNGSRDKIRGRNFVLQGRAQKKEAEGDSPSKLDEEEELTPEPRRVNGASAIRQLCAGGVDGGIDDNGGAGAARNESSKLDEKQQRRIPEPVANPTPVVQEDFENSNSIKYFKGARQSTYLPGEDGGMKRRRDVAVGAPVIQTPPPSRVKRTRVTSTTAPCLRSNALILNSSRGEGTAGAEIVQKADKADTQSIAEIPVPPLPMETTNNSNKEEFGGSSQHDLWKDRSGASEKQEKTVVFSSLMSSLPPSCKSIGNLDHVVAELLEMYSLLRSFSTVIFLSPFSLEEFAYALRLDDSCPMTDCVHLSLLQTLRRQLERLSKNGSKSATFTLRLSDWTLLDHITWPSFLVGYLLTQGFNFGRGDSLLKEGLSTDEYYQLPIETKLTVLRFLCNKVLETEEARAEIARRAILENDPEMSDMKGCLQKKQQQGREGTLADVPEVDDEDEHVGFPPGSHPLPPPFPLAAANSIRVGRNLDEDGILDECVLCAMDGNLICCDGCPAAYHSRCVGVSRQGLPPGDWFCPECRADKLDQRGADIPKGVRGGQLLAVGPEGQLFFDACGYTLISETSAEGKTSHQVYSPCDLQKVFKILDHAGPGYAQVKAAMKQIGQAETNVAEAAAAGPATDGDVLPLDVSTEDGLPHHEEKSTNSGGGGDIRVHIDKSFSNDGSITSTEQAKVLDPHDPLSLLPVNPETPLAATLALPADQTIENNSGATIADSKPANGHRLDGIPGSLHTEEVAQVQYVYPNETGQLVSGERVHHSAIDEVNEKLEHLWKNHKFFDVPGAIADPTVQFNEQKAAGELRSDEKSHVSENLNFSSVESPSGAAPTVPTCQNGSINLTEIKEGQVVAAGPETSVEARDGKGCAQNGGQPSAKASKRVRASQSIGPRSDKSTEALRKEKSVRSSFETVTKISASTYINKYGNCDYVATTAFNLAIMAGGVDDLVDDKSGSLKKTTRPTSVADQVKAFTQASGHFYWPSVKKRAKDVSKEKCGWCINCRSPCRRACLLTQVVGQMAGGASLVVGGIRLIKGNYGGHFPEVAAYILYLEENLLGLLEGPWVFPGHRKKWRKQIEQAKSIQDVKVCLLQLESSLRRVALSPDWNKVEEDAPESIANSATHISAASVSISKKNSSRKRGRPSIVHKAPTANSYDGACFGVNWWRGGTLSRLVYNWESLSRTAIKRAARRGGFREIPDLVYSKGLDLPRRTRRFAWRTRLEKIFTIAQIAVEVRHLDTFIRWNDIINPSQTTPTHIIKRSPDSDPAFWKAEIRAKEAEENGKFKYLLGFSKEADTKKEATTLQSVEQEETEAAPNDHPIEKPVDKKQQAPAAEEAASAEEDEQEEVWLAESEVPLFLLKDYEERIRRVNHEKLPSPMKKVKGRTPSQKQQRKRFSFWKKLCTPYLPAGDTHDLSTWICGYCQQTDSESSRSRVKCQKCSGEFHRDCTQIEDSTSGREKVRVCRVCVKLRQGQRMRKPSYKMLVMQSQSQQLANGNSAVLCNNEDAALPSSDDAEEGDVRVGGTKSKRKKEKGTDTDSKARRRQELLSRKKAKKKRNSPVSGGPSASPSTHDESTQLEDKKSVGKKNKKVLVTVVPAQHKGDSIGRRPNKRMKMAAAAVDSENNDESLLQSRSSRKQEVVSLVPSQSSSQRRQETSQGRRMSGRLGFSGVSPSALTPPMASAAAAAAAATARARLQKQKRPRGRPPKSGYLLEKESMTSPRRIPRPHLHQRGSSKSTQTRRTGRGREGFPYATNAAAAVGADADAGAPYDELQEAEKTSPIRRKRLKIIFAGLEVTSSRNVNNKRASVGREEVQTPRRSGNGLDYGCRSAKSEDDIQRFRQERLVLADQEGLDPDSAPVCSLCLEDYEPGHVYVSCEFCEDWYHGEAVGVKVEDAAFLVGFKCHRCRKCRAPSCPVVPGRGEGVKDGETDGDGDGGQSGVGSGSGTGTGTGSGSGDRIGESIGDGEVSDADNMSSKAMQSLESGSSSDLQSSDLNSPDKEFSAFNDAKAFPEFVAATNQAEEALAADGSNFGHDVLSRGFDMSDLVLSGDSQLQLNPLSLGGDQQGNVWASNGSVVPVDLPSFSTSQGDDDLSSRAAPLLSLTELLASEDEYFDGVGSTGPGGLNSAWAGAGGGPDDSGTTPPVAPPRPPLPAAAAATSAAGAGGADATSLAAGLDKSPLPQCK